MIASESMDLAAQAHLYELRGAEEIVHNPIAAVRTFRLVHRLPRKMRDERRAVAAVMAMAMAYSRVGREQSTVRLLELALRQSPDWYAPATELAMQRELEADRALAKGDLVTALRKYRSAAIMHRRALSILESGADSRGRPSCVADERARLACCEAEAAKIEGPSSR